MKNRFSKVRLNMIGKFNFKKIFSFTLSALLLLSITYFNFNINVQAMDMKHFTSGGQVYNNNPGQNNEKEK
jgi:hypothetical protein